MIEVRREWDEKSRLKRAHIMTSGGTNVTVSWAKNGEATIFYGRRGQKPRRLVGLPPDGMEFGDSVGNQRNVFNGFVVKHQSIIKKCEASLILDGKEMPSNQMVFDLNRSYLSRQDKEIMKLEIVAEIFGLSLDESRQVASFARNLRDARPGRQ
jgi:hypothetical protein